MMLNAVLCVWNEEDIIESTVKHLFAQGCSNVFIVDNDSADNTVNAAINAGATLAAKFTTKDFDEEQKVAHLNAVVRYVNATMSEDRIWWLYVDADEFPNIENGVTIANYINILSDNGIMAGHGYLFNHMPTHPPYHICGYHPIDCQPLCVKDRVGKIPLIRYDKNSKHFFSIGGAHQFISNGQSVPIVKDLLHIHHFPHRNPKHTVKRLKILAETRNEWYKKFLKQVHGTEMRAYEDRYEQALMVYKNKKNTVLKTKKIIYDFKNIVRWYDIHTEKNFKSSYYAKSIYNAVYNFFMKEYDISLCRFNDALNALDLCEDNEIKLWIKIKMAECFAYSDLDTAHAIISDVEKSDNQECLEYIDKDFEYIRNSNKAKNSEGSMKRVEMYQTTVSSYVEERRNISMAKAEKNFSPF